MGALQLQAEIQELLRREKNIAVLEAIRMLLRREESAGSDLTEAEIAEFDRNHEAFLRGEVKGIKGRDSVKRLRKAQVRNGEV